ncbi:Tkl/drk protein kinase, partial [Globisporangium splendens]
MHHEQRHLRRVLNATDPTASIIIPAETMFVFNGTSSDLAQQFYQRYQAGDTLAKLSISHKNLPRPIQDRLAKYQLKFKDLHALLQRALLWDSGYVLDASVAAKGSAMKLVQIYTANDTTMADIAVSYAKFTNGAGCAVANCSMTSSHESTTDCQGSRLAPMLKCAVAEQLTSTTHSSTSFWATGGNAKAIPDLSIASHSWIDSETKETYTVNAIHTIPMDQESSARCASDAAGNDDFSSMIIPCASYETLALSSSVSTQWSAPKHGKLVTVWLEHAQADKPGFNMYYTVLIIVGVIAGLMLLIVLACKGKSRFRKQQQRRAEAKMTSADPQAFLDASFGSSEQLEVSSTAVALTPVQAILESDHENRKNDWNHAFLSSDAFAGKRLRMDHLAFRKQITKTARNEIWIATYHGERVAVKKIRHETSELLGNDDKISRSAPEARNFIPDWSHGIERLASLRHCNIARFYGVAWDSPESLCVISEYARKGNLQHVLGKQSNTSAFDKEPLTWEQMRRILVGVARALQYLYDGHPHSPIVHGDLCCKNILLSNHYEPKLIGFTTTDTTPASDTVVEQEVGSSSSSPSIWIAPEVLHGAPMSPQSDIYSFGVLMSELLSHHATILRVESDEEHKQEGEEPVFLRSIVCEIMAHCLQVDPSLRPTASAIVQVLESEESQQRLSTKLK